MSDDALILVYHRIAAADLDPWELAVSPSHFEEQMRVLAAERSAVRLERLGESLPLRGHPVVITFDDGYADNLTHALPVLRQYDLPATLFACSGAIADAREFWWDRLERLVLWPSVLPQVLDITIAGRACTRELETSVYEPAEYERYVAWRAWEPPPTERHALFVQLWERLQRLAPAEQEAAIAALEQWAMPDSTPRHTAMNASGLLDLCATGHITCGAHTVSHPALDSLAPADQRTEIAASRAWLEKTIGRPVTTFAYPYGRPVDYGAATLAIVEEEGFLCACANVPGPARWKTERYQLRRNQVGDWDGDEFSRQLRQWRDSVGDPA
jgi:peptidoglycan/xylan/chitin deacetylase (PgdA/CDA1 family)